MRDSIAERAAAAEELRESEARLRAAVVAAPYPLMLHAEDGDDAAAQPRVVGAERVLPTRAATTSDWTRAPTASGDAVDARSSRLRRERAGRGVPTAFGERPVRTADGDMRVWDFHSVSLGRLPDGRRLRLVAARDVTDYRQLLESERARGEEAEKANRGEDASSSP